jgi:hypothetical protein
MKGLDKGGQGLTSGCCAIEEDVKYSLGYCKMMNSVSYTGEGILLGKLNLGGYDRLAVHVAWMGYARHAYRPWWRNLLENDHLDMGE